MDKKILEGLNQVCVPELVVAETSPAKRTTDNYLEYLFDETDELEYDHNKGDAE